ncbi:MAG: hypothetical protein ACW97A_03850 [Candidatus Thorarchaeota archaeon]|jgi:hypothetical protein
MAEQFLNRLDKIEKKIEGLGETLKRMITILGTVTEIKSEVRQAKDETLDAIKNQPQPAVSQSGMTSEEVGQIVQIEVTSLGNALNQSIEFLKGELQAAIMELAQSIPLSPPPAAPAPAPKPKPKPKPKPEPTPEPEPVAPPPVEPASEPAPMATGTLSADKGMKIADQLDIILKSLRMGCKAGPVLEIIAESKEEILKIVPSDPIMIKIDKWSGVVANYSKRHELQAKDILKLKKDLRAEIPKYRPA